MILCYWLLSSSKKKISFLMLSTVSMLSHVLCLVAQSSLDFLPSAWPVACQAPLSMKILQARILEWVAMPSSRVFPTQGLNAGLLHCRWILYHLSHKGSPRILEWVAYRFSRGTGVSCIAGRFFTNWTIRESLSIMPFKSNQVAANGNISFFLWLSSIPLRLVSS